MATSVAALVPVVSPNVTPPAPRALAEFCADTVPLLIVRPKVVDPLLVKEFTPDKVRPEVKLF